MSKLNVKVSKDRVKITMDNPFYIISINEYDDGNLIDSEIGGLYLRKNQAENHLLAIGYETAEFDNMYQKNITTNQSSIAYIKTMVINDNNVIDLPL